MIRSQVVELGEPEGLLEALTERELEVLSLLAQGQRNAEIAEGMVVTVKTVEYHVSNILSKLRVRSRTEAILKARNAFNFSAPGQ